MDTQPPISLDTASGIVLPERPPHKERRAERSVAALYLIFFLLWTLGLCVGLFADGPALFFGLPLWFGIGGIFAYGAVCLMLAYTVRRFFR